MISISVIPSFVRSIILFVTSSSSGEGVYIWVGFIPERILVDDELISFHSSRF